MDQVDSDTVMRRERPWSKKNLTLSHTIGPFMYGTQHNFQVGLILRSSSTIKKDVIPTDCVSNNELWDVVHYQSVEGGSSRKWVRTGAHFTQQEFEDTERITDYTPNTSLSLLSGLPQYHHSTVFFIQLNTKLQVTKTSF